MEGDRAGLFAVQVDDQLDVGVVGCGEGDVQAGGGEAGGVLAVADGVAVELGMSPLGVSRRLLRMMASRDGE